MKLWQRTLIGVVVGVAMLALLVQRLLHDDMPAKSKALIAGIALMAGGVMAFPMRLWLNKTAPTLDKDLTVVWGYGIPKKWGWVTWFLLIIGGLGLIVWSTKL